MTEIRGERAIPSGGEDTDCLEDLLRIRPLADSDVTAVCDLWSGYVTEGFIDNFGVGEPDPSGDLGQYLSLDRWGPGISAPMLPDAPRPHMPKEPSFAVVQQVSAMVGHPFYRCLVAELTGVPVGFLVCSIRPLATMTDRVASFDELFVDPVARRAGIGTALVERALDDLHREGIGVFHALVPKSDRYAGACKFFTALGWEEDLAAFGLYD